MGKKKLLIFMGSMGRGGAERVISHISNYFVAKGWKVYIALLLFNKVDYELDPNVEIIDLTGSTSSRIKRVPTWIISIRKIVNTINPDTILSFAARINIIVQLACFRLSNKIVVSERNDPYKDGRTVIVDFFTKKLYSKAKAVVFQTERAATYFDEMGLKNSLIIPNPISIQCSKAEVSSAKIVTVGRLTKQKNQELLIRSFALISCKNPEYKLYIYGDGELRKELEDLSESLGVKDKVFFEGNVSDVHARIADAEIFVLSSDYEGLSNALLEAMMMGLPCISTNCAGSDEYIVDEKNGLLVAVGDENALASAIQKFINNRDLRISCGRNARNVLSRVSTEVVLEKWYTLLSK